MAIVSKSDRRAIERQMLGWGPAAEQIDPGLDVVLDITFVDGAGGRDLKLVSGMDALVQDLRVAFTTALGSDPLNGDFGFDGIRALAEESNPFVLRERVRAAIVRVLQRDSRVRRIVDVRLGAESEAPSMPVRMLKVTVLFETIVGETATVTLGRVAASE